MNSPQLIEGLWARSPAAFACLFRLTAAWVYRYHLVRSGDTLEAQERTATTFQAAIEWMAAYQPNQEGLLTWLFRLARRSQMGVHRRVSAPPVMGASGPAAEEQAVRTLQAVQVSGVLRGLRSERAEALALHLFGGLDPAETGRVLGKSRAAVEKILRGGLADLQDQALAFGAPGAASPEELAGRLAGLAAGLQTDTAFTSGLWARLERDLLSQRSGRPAWQGWLAELGFRARTLLTSRVFTGLVIAALLTGGLAASLSLIPQTTREPPPPAQPTEEGVLSAPNSAGGYLVPPPLAVCQEWQRRLASRLQLEIDLVPIVYIHNRGDYGNDTYGTGCQLKASGDGSNFGSTQEMSDRVEAILNAEARFKTATSTRGLPYIMEPAEIQDWYGSGAVYSNQELRAIVTVGWRPSQAAERLCNPGMAEAQCALHPADRLFHLSILLGADLFHPVVERFIQRWEQGQNSATELFSTGLLARLPNAAALDRLAGLERNKIPSPGLSWQVIANSGDAARVELVLWDGPPAHATTHALATLQMLLKPTEPESSAWQITDLIHGVFFAPSEDTLVLADEHGQVYLLDLNTLTRRNISERGVYSPAPALDPVAQSTTHAWLSPDVQRLLVSGERGAWLIWLQKRSAVMIAGPLAQAAWSPDSQRLVYTETGPSAGTLVLYTTGTGSRELARIDQPVVDIAWSPRGDRIAAAELASATSQQETLITADLNVWLIDAASGQAAQAAKLGRVAYYSPLTRLLAWTIDQSEVWLLPAQTAIHLADGSLRLLAARPVNNQNVPMQNIFQTVQYSLLGMSSPWFGQPSIQILSPDHEHAAGGVLTADGEVDYLGVKEVDKGQGSFSDSYTWSHSVSGVQSLAYTLEGNSLIAARGVNRLGSIWRFNALSGDGQKIVEGAAYLGLLSQLQKNSLRLAPEVRKTHLPDPQPGETWTTFSLDLDPKMSFQVPPGWACDTRLDYYQGIATIRNVDFSDLFGWASLDQKDLMIEMYLEDLSHDDPARQWLVQIQADRSGEWEQVTLAGRTAFRMAHIGQGRSPQRMIIPLEKDRMLQILKYPATSAEDGVFEQILGSIRFPGE
ncbi:MAG TPA: hypothetical protein VMT46_14835 [Anaerolineaceae bacterium]|nr:hypothetical protein [Anaerolineaceae bacterium]